MPTTDRPTYTAVKAKIVELLNAVDRLGALGITAEYAWPGPGTTITGVWLDNPGAPILTETPAVQGSARHFRNERYRVNILIQVVNQSRSSAGVSAQAQAVEDQAFDVLAVVDSLFADDKSVGDSPGVLEGKLVEYTPEPMEPSGQGWAARITAVAEVSAWLI
jgi:hypothetical protein